MKEIKVKITEKNYDYLVLLSRYTGKSKQRVCRDVLEVFIPKILKNIQDDINESFEVTPKDREADSESDTLSES